MPMVTPIGVVVVHYGTDDLTMRCLRALLEDRMSPPTQVVLVDNGPAAGIEGQVREALPAVRVVTPGRNLGFAGGCNAGVAALDPGVELVALVNSDVEVSEGWLLPLLEALDTGPRVGAACPKICFDGRFHTVELEADRTWTPGWGDRRALAWRFEGAEVPDGAAGCQLVDGFWEPGARGTWAGPHAVLRVPATGAPRVRLWIGTPPRAPVTLRVTPSEAVLDVPPGGGPVDVPLSGPAERVINNVGTAWRPDGYGVDLGFQEPDRGQHDAPGEVPAWCGGAVLLRRAYLDELGGFDERLFLYYEDLELSLRGAARGWTYRYEPTSVVAHRHAASAAAQRIRVARLKERNRLLVLARHGPVGRLLRELARSVLVALSYARRDVLSPLLRGERPEWGPAWARIAGSAGALRSMPRMLASRWRDRRASGMRTLA